jgi:hypothetical protein
VPEPPQLGQAWAAVAVLGLADERYWRAGGPRAAAARERQELVLDEFPYLVQETPGLPSIVQSLYDSLGPGARGEQRRHTAENTRARWCRHHLHSRPQRYPAELP